MRKILLALAFVVTVALSRGVYERDHHPYEFLQEEETVRNPLLRARRDMHREEIPKLTKKSNINVELDETNIRDLIEDFRDFGVEYWKETEEEREEVLEALKDAYRNTASKLLMNFGKTFNPILFEWADIMKYVQVNRECDQECAVECLDYRKRDTMFFNERCLATCGCSFGINKVKPDKIKKHANKLREELDDAMEFLEKIKLEDVKIVKPSIDNYLTEERTLHKDFANLVRKHAVKTFGCDRECISECVDRPTKVSIFELPVCLSRCDCDLDELIDVDVRRGANLAAYR